LRNGINVAVGDVNGDGQAEIITGAGRGSLPEVKVFNNQGKLLQSFFAYNRNSLGGVNVAVGDVNGDGQAEIITGAKSGDAPEVKIFRADGLLLSQFFAFNEHYVGGLSVAVGDVNGDGLAEVVVGVENNSFSTVVVYTYLGAKLSSFMAYDPPFVGGINLAVADLDNDGLAEIITGKNIAGQADVKVFDLVGVNKFKFNAYRGNYTGGVRLSAISF